MWQMNMGITQRRFLRSLLPFAIVASLAIAAAPAQAGLLADPPADNTIAAGVRVGGVAIGGLTREVARTTLYKKLYLPMRAPVRVRSVGRVRYAYAADLGWNLDLDALIAKAYLAGRSSGALTQIKAKPEIDLSSVREFVGRVAVAVRIRTRSAKFHYTVKRVWITPHRSGRRLADQGALATTVVARFSSARASRLIFWGTDPVGPARRTVDVRQANKVFITVSKSERRVRLFRWLHLVKRYRVAIGQPGYPTPEGLFHVYSKQVDPAWSVPREAWAGDLGGKTIPGGSSDNPLKARWIGFAPGVGFHGTADGGSIGSAASHGCLRMWIDDVKDLYPRVPIGTPVYVTS